MCKVLEVSRSGFYQWIKRKPNQWIEKNKELTEQIKSIFKESSSTYGSPRISKVLQSRKIFASRPRVARLMKNAGIVSKIRKRFISTTDSKHNFPLVENKLDRNFFVEQTGRVWVSDITYISTEEGWLYLTIIMDLADRKIIGWSLSDSMKAAVTVIPAWRMANSNRPIEGNLIFHSDRGIQYACTEFKEILEQNNNVIRSMSRKGNCWDNAVAESFFKSLKVELIYGNNYKTRKEASISVFEYIEIWYNTKRIHSSLGYKSPKSYKISIAENAA